MLPILGNFDGSIVTPLGGVSGCLGKNGTMPSGMSTLNLVGPGGGNGTNGVGATGVVGNVGIIGTIGVVSFGIVAVIRFTNAKPNGILSKAINLLILHLFLLL
tara:strand:- start:126 stop:434 length:309 start_codon:yes stop_codon:yes gene_type:complete